MAQGPRFDAVVPPRGYAWWYLDATSADGRHGLTVIIFVGSVFSPYYKITGRGRPDNHCAVNVAMNGPRGSAWAMTERGAASVSRGPDHFHAGPSAVEWDGECLTIAVEERSFPIPYPVRGKIRLWPDLLATTGFALDGDARHRWHPIAPRARVQVDMDRPGISWAGSGYLDSNFGDEPLEDGFRDWHWSRAHLSRDVAVLYEGLRRDDRPFGLALLCDRQGRWREAEAPPPHRLGRSGWAIDRRTRADRDAAPRIARTWIDAPFYARSGIDTRLFGERCFAVHETLSLDRFASPVVQSMLPYRMPRAIV